MCIIWLMWIVFQIIPQLLIFTLCGLFKNGLTKTILNEISNLIWNNYKQILNYWGYIIEICYIKLDIFNATVLHVGS